MQRGRGALARRLPRTGRQGDPLDPAGARFQAYRAAIGAHGGVVILAKGDTVATDV